MPPAGHALWAEVGGGITFVTSGENTKKNINCLLVSLGTVGIYDVEPYMLVGQPSLHGSYACMVYWAKGALRRNCRHKQCKTSCSLFRVFQFVAIPGKGSGGLVFWHLWIGRARHPGPSSVPSHLGVDEVLNVGGWLTHGDLALDTGVDFLAVVEHRLIAARAS